MKIPNTKITESVSIATSFEKAEWYTIDGYYPKYKLYNLSIDMIADVKYFAKKIYEDQLINSNTINFYPDVIHNITENIYYPYGIRSFELIGSLQKLNYTHAPVMIESRIKSPPFSSQTMSIYEHAINFNNIIKSLILLDRKIIPISKNEAIIELSYPNKIVEPTKIKATKINGKMIYTNLDTYESSTTLRIRKYDAHLN